MLPYKNITTSGAVYLSFSFGRPVIAPMITSFPEVVTPETGLLFGTESLEDLEKALSNSSVFSWKESLIIEYAKEFDWDRIGQQISKMYL